MPDKQAFLLAIKIKISQKKKKLKKTAVDTSPPFVFSAKNSYF